MKKLFIILISIPYFLTAQVKNPTSPKIQTQPNSNKIASVDFEYDAVGNVTKDLTQGISNIDYVSISRMEPDPYVGGMTSISVHLPRQITFLDGRKIKNQYDATGRKLVTQLLINNVISVEYSYVGNLTYIRTPGKDWKLIEMKIDEGRIVPKSNNSTEMVYEYDIQDQTGSPRVSFRENTTTGKAEMVRKQDYDPFGLPLKGIDYQSPTLDTLSKKYFFNGKEYLVTIGLKMYDYGLRTYNPRLGRFYQIDPKASMMPSWSPYSFSFDNPVRFRDYDGAYPYPITIRSFAPIGSFRGTGFHDDGRSFSTRSDVTSRISQTYTVDPSARSISGGTPTSSPTIFGSLSMIATDEGSVSASFSKNSSGNVASIQGDFEGSNPFFLGAAPDIEVSSYVTLTENTKKGTLGVSVDLSSKQFPATEAMIQDNKKQTVFLGGAAAYGNAGSLVSASKSPIKSLNLTINIDKNGAFQSVMYGNKTYSVDEFNKTFSSGSAGPYPRGNK